MLVKHSSRSAFSEIVHDESGRRLLGDLLGHLRTPLSRDDLFAAVAATSAGRACGDELGALLDGVLTYLVDRAIVVDAATDPTTAYLDLLGDGGQRRLDRVGVVGAGPLGRRIAAALAALNPSAMRILDGRAVTSVDARRLATTGAGDTAARVLAAELGVDTAPGDLTDPAALRGLFADSDLVVLALDEFSPALLHTANEVAVEAVTTWFSVFTDGSEGVVGPLYVPGETCCYQEYAIQQESAMLLKGDFLLYKEARDAAGITGFGATLPCHLDLVAGLAATAVLQHLLRGRSVLAGRAVHVEFESLTLDYHNVMRLPRCVACADVVPAYRNLFQ
ncbi:TOMM precursor leader peptide-binding protein [Actinomycetes bacterium KLBMP 9797]